MLRLRACITSHTLSSTSISAISTLRRFVSAASPAISPHPGFAVEDYLVHTCGLTRPHAHKASTKLSHLKSPANPGAVLTFLAGLGLSSADIAAAVVKDPRLLCARVEGTLAPVVVGLTGLGLSTPDIARLVATFPNRFRCRSVISKLQCYLPLFGSVENLLRVLKKNDYLLGTDLDKVAKPNVAFLRECGLATSDIAKMCVHMPMMLSTRPTRVRAMVVCTESIGVLHGSGMFRQALQSVAFLSKEKITAKVDYLKKTFGWSDAEVRIAVTRAPMLLQRSKDMLQRRSTLFISEMGLEPAYIAHRPIIISFSIEGRLRPRYYVLKFLKVNGLLDRNWGYYYIFKIREEEFVKKFICPHKEAAPHLAEDYAATCSHYAPVRGMHMRGHRRPRCIGVGDGTVHHAVQHPIGDNLHLVAKLDDEEAGDGADH